MECFGDTFALSKDESDAFFLGVRQLHQHLVPEGTPA